MMRPNVHLMGLRWSNNVRSLKSGTISQVFRFQKCELLHGSRFLFEGRDKVRIGKTEAEKRLENHPEFQKVTQAFEDSRHDHIHMRESESEQNDVFQLGSMLHRGASHTHSHASVQENPLLKLDKDEIKKNPGVRITWIGLLINVGLAAGKFAGGIIFHSQALIADSVHALSDLISDFLTLLSVGLSSREPTAEYPDGYGKIETLGSLSVSTILAVAGLSIGWSSLCAIVAPLLPHTVMDILTTYTHTHSHGATSDVADINAAWIAGGSIVVKEWIFRATKKVAIETNSNVLLANAWHHRVDSLTSLVALVTISSGYFFSIQSLDAVGGLLVSALVVKAGADGMLTSMKELIDKAVPKEDPRFIAVQENTLEILKKMVSNNNAIKPYGLKDLSLLSSGPNFHAKITLEVPIQRWENVLTIKEFEIVSDHLRTALRENIPNLRNVYVEYVEEKPVLTAAEMEEIETQKNMGSPPAPKNEARAEELNQSCGHSHSHFGWGDGHTHKH